MGIVKFMAKLGTPGSMTRSVIKGYRAFKGRYPEMGDNEIYHEIIKARYMSPKDKTHYDKVALKIDTYKSLYDLVVEINHCEIKDYYSLSFKAKVEISKAVKEILYKEGLD